jgi:hypothetical protein
MDGGRNITWVSISIFDVDIGVGVRNFSFRFGRRRGREGEKGHEKGLDLRSRR